VRTMIDKAGDCVSVVGRRLDKNMKPRTAQAVRFFFVSAAETGCDP
jgi:hypothetical protein